MHTVELSTDQIRLILRLLESYKPQNGYEDMDAEFIRETFSRTIEIDTVRDAAFELADALRELHDFGAIDHGKHKERSDAAFKRAGQLLQKLDK